MKRNELKLSCILLFWNTVFIRSCPVVYVLYTPHNYYNRKSIYVYIQQMIGVLAARNNLNVKVPLRRNFSNSLFLRSESLSGTYLPVRAVLSNKHGKMDFFTVFPETFLAAIINSCSCNPIRPCCFVTSFT